MSNALKKRKIDMNTCRICSHEAKLVYEGFPGYKQGSFYSVYYCDNCDSSYAEPLEIDEELYNIIYSKARFMPGYDRYFRFSEDVLKVQNPLKYLAEMEDTYWAVDDFLSKHKEAKSAKILEVGCGLGYLTYSLVKAGFNIKGVDISTRAIEEAKKKYGPYYEQADIYEYSKGADRFDVIILTEVIEHIPNPAEFIEAVKSLLHDNGHILITTPNKSKHISRELHWDTELPPVHLWWLSETSFEKIATRLNMQVTFTDFTDFCNKNLNKRTFHNPWRQQTLDSSNNILFNVPHNPFKHIIRMRLIEKGIWKLSKSFISKFTGNHSSNNASSDRLCAVLSKN